MKLRSRAVFPAVLAVVAVLLLARTGDVALIDPDEARFARTSLEMSRSGDLVVPTFEGAPRLVKPPLLHWLQLYLFRLLGPGEWAARLPSALATLAMVWITGRVAARRLGPEAAPWAAVILGTTPLVVGVGRLGTMDALLALHVLAVVALDLTEPERPGPYRTLAIGLLAGLAFLAKGPVGVILPAILVLAGRTATGREVVPSLGSALRVLAGWSVAVLPWGLVFLRRVGLEASGATLRAEVLERFYSGTDHVEPPWYYAQVLLIGFAPWVAPMIVAVVRAVRLRRDPAARTGSYAAAAMVAGLAFFSLGRGKLPSYLVPLAPLAALLVTWELARELDEREGRRLGPALLAGVMGAFALLLGGIWMKGPGPEAARAAALGSVAYLGGVLFAVPAVLRRDPRRVYLAAAASTALFLLAATTLFLPALAERRSARDLVQSSPELSGGRPVVVVEMRLPSLTWYLDRVPEKIDAATLGSRLERGDDPLLVFDRVDLARVEPEIRRRLVEIGRAGKYHLLEIRIRGPERNPPGPARGVGTPPRGLLDGTPGAG